MKQTIYFFLVLFSIPCLAQNPISIQAKIIDVNTKTPIAYCNVSLLHQQKGAYTDSAGYFHLPTISPQDTICISALAYEKQWIPAHQFQVDSLPILALTPINIDLPTFIVQDFGTKKSRTRTKVLGSIKEKVRMSYSCVQGYVMAKYIPNVDQQVGLIQKAIFAFKPTKATKHKAKVRVRVWSVDPKNGQPAQDLLADHVMSIVKKKQKVWTIDLSDYQLPFPKNGVFIGIEWLGNVDAMGQLLETTARTLVAPTIAFQQAETNYNTWVGYRNNKWGLCLVYKRANENPKNAQFALKVMYFE